MPFFTEILGGNPFWIIEGRLGPEAELGMRLCGLEFSSVNLSSHELLCALVLRTIQHSLEAQGRCPARLPFR